ncbi:MAG: beta-lactamase family protein [Bacteroidetes bacterium]|nr:beta-lactamase family protein [Bacteroidota bacterium]
MRRRHRYWLLLLCYVLTSLTPAQTWSDSLHGVLSGIATRYQLAGMSVAVVKHDSVVFARGYGLADIGRSIAMTDSSIYRIASISKTITALAVMKLYEQGAFGLDDDVSTALGFTLRNPAFPSQPVTYRRLLSHTSSLRDGTGYNAFLSATYANASIPALSELLVSGGASFSSDMWSATRGSASAYFAYANINFGVLGTLVERLSGKRFDVFCREQILAPLGLDASFNVHDLRNMNNVAVLYRYPGGVWTAQADDFGGVKPTPRDLSGYALGTNGLIFGPQGGLRVSARGLATIMRLLANGGTVNGVRILRDTTVARMLTTNWTYSGSNGDPYYGIFNAYACGISPTTALIQGQALIGHPGEAYGLISDMYAAANGSYGIVFLTNGSKTSYALGSYSGWYRVEEEVYTAAYQIGVLLSTTSVCDPGVPTGMRLEPNYPNPFNPTTRIRWSIEQEGRVRLSVVDLLGHEVAVLADRESGAGEYLEEWDAAGVPSGIYITRLQVSGRDGRTMSVSRTMTLVR